MRKLIVFGVSVVVIGTIGFLALTSPLAWRIIHAPRDVANSEPPDLVNGKTLFIAADCAICHASPGQQDATRLGGGRLLVTGFGTFHMPNISPELADGIGHWSVAQFTAAMREGVSPRGENEYPAFPYTSYQRMSANDVRDLFGYLRTLPAVSGKVRDHDLKFPFNLRRGLGLWRLAFLDGKPARAEPTHDAAWNRGHYLIEGPAQCAECHSPRDFAGAIVSDKRFAGGPGQDGTSYTPNITPDETGIGYWSDNEVVDYLRTATSPIDIHAGADMAEIVADTPRLPDADLHAMAVYLKSLPPVDAPDQGMPEPNRTTLVRRLPVKDAAAAQSKLNALSTPATDPAAAAATQYVVTTKSFFIDRAAATAKGPADGKVLGPTKLAVLARSGDLLEVRIDGWQQDGTDAAFYALQGQRIVQAVLTPAAIAKVVRSKTVHDPLMHLDWHPASLTVWVDPQGLNPDITVLWKYTAGLYGDTCAACHALPASTAYLSNQWVGTRSAMKRYASIDEGQYRLLLAWLQYHSKDVGAPIVAGAP
jgi:mono/diheme cytochrome c family protein